MTPAVPSSWTTLLQSLGKSPLWRLWTFAHSKQPVLMHHGQVLLGQVVCNLQAVDMTLQANSSYYCI